jgi:hypothetical protein
MKTLIKVSDLELIKNGQGIALLRAGVVVAKFTNEQLLPAIIALISLAGKKNKQLQNGVVSNCLNTLLSENNRQMSTAKVVSNFQQSLF